MRTTLDVDDDVLAAAKEIARRQRRTAGAVLSDLARQTLQGSTPPLARADFSFLGFEPIGPGGQVVTGELVEQLLDEDDL